MKSLTTKILVALAVVGSLAAVAALLGIKGSADSSSDRFLASTLDQSGQ